MKTSTTDRFTGFVHAGQLAQRAVDRAIARAELLRRLEAARRTVRALRDELLDAEIKLGFAQIALDELDHAGRAP
jgi:hypothetical protein